MAPAGSSHLRRIPGVGERLPGIGEELARRIHDELGVETLEALEHAAYTGRWELHALFSNTPRAHELGRTHDWVVIYWHRDGVRGPSTVVTAWSDELDGSRVVRGREAECRAYYDSVRPGPVGS